MIIDDPRAGRRWTNEDRDRALGFLADLIASRAPRPCLHFVGFRGDEYNRARRVFGEPDFIHMTWDRRAAREIAGGDVVLFARGEHDQPVQDRNGSDIVEHLYG